MRVGLSALFVFLMLNGVAWGQELAGPAARLRKAVTDARASGRLLQVAGEQHLLSDQTAMCLRLKVDDGQVLLEVETVDLGPGAEDLAWRSVLCLDGVGTVTSLSTSMLGAWNASVSARWLEGDRLRWEEAGPAKRTGEFRCADVFLPEEAKWLWALLGDGQDLVCCPLSLSPFGSDPQGAYYLDPRLSCFGETTASNQIRPDGQRVATGFDQSLEVDPAGRIMTIRRGGALMWPLPEQPEEVFRAVTPERYMEALEAARLRRRK